MDILDRIDWGRVGAIAAVTMPIHFGLFLIWWRNARRARRARRPGPAAPPRQEAPPPPAADPAPSPAVSALPPPPLPPPMVPAEAPARPRLATRVNRYGNVETYIERE